MTTTFKNFKLSDSYLCTDFPTWDKKHLKKKYKINIKNLDNGKRSSFTFWTPDAITEEEELLSTFYYFLSDADAGTYRLNEFYQEFCGDGDLENAIKAHNDCQKAYKKFYRLMDCNTDKTYQELYNLLNELSEIAG